ncbi:UNVERIFIED_CONTAM: hypothetical protein Sradi_5051400 [Sesamum radiatum]|uniref:Uncharacterized protein n=1 Tax=Sesamum radiatum TaxID=300843 RepID=A0AAW2M452_SESRA
MRQYEAVGAPMIALIHATAVDEKAESYDERRYKVTSLQVGGIKVRTSAGPKHIWDGEKQS